MLRKCHSALLTGLLIIGLSACGGEQSETNSEGDSATIEKEESTPKQEDLSTVECDLAGFSFVLGDRERSLSMEYEGELLVGAVMREKGSLAEQRVKYEYDGKGRLTGVSLDGDSRADYVYNDEGQVARVDGSGNLMSRAFVYDDDGRITTQTTFFNGNPYNTLQFGYDDEGVLRTVALIDKNNEAVETKSLEYDDKKNPFRNTGPWVNSTEMLLGYPVGNCPNNIVKITTTYDKKTAYQVNGKIREAGETSVQERAFQYNAQGYPEKITLNRNGATQDINISYNCPDS